MKIASVTIYCNERFRLEAWKEYHAGYRDELYLHVIVNNGDASETAVLRESFPDSLILESPTRNMMASYNLALRKILEDPEVDAIAQIVNDIRLSPGCFSGLYGYLFSDPSLAMVSPVLLRKDSDIIDCYGCAIDPGNLDFIHCDAGRDRKDIPEGTRLVSGLPAGIPCMNSSASRMKGWKCIATRSIWASASPAWATASERRIGFRPGISM